MKKLKTKKRLVGGSYVFTVPKEFAEDPQSETYKNEPQLYEVRMDKDMRIIYSPIEIIAKDNLTNQ